MPVYDEGDDWAVLAGRIRIPVGYTDSGEPIYDDAESLWP